MIVKKDKIITDIYYKPTDTQNYVPLKSTHPRHTLQNIPHNLARRLCIILDETTTLSEGLEKLKAVLLHLGYLKQTIETAMWHKKGQTNSKRNIKKTDSKENINMPALNQCIFQTKCIFRKKQVQKF